MSYGNVYVAQISIGADKRHALEQILKAEAYPGPSLIIAYCPCINHGIKAGMGKSIQQSKKIVECGLWPLYHYDPTQKERGESPFKVDTGSQTGDFMEYIQSEVRFDALRLQFPGRASELYEKARQDCQERTEFYQKLEQLF